MSETPEIFQFIGRLHTVVLHLPIGFLVLAFILEGASRFTAFEQLKPSISFVLATGMIAAITTAIFGYILSLEDGYEAAILWNHKWLGIGTVLLSMLLYFFRKKKGVYESLLIGLMFLLMFTGHTGGSITHGEQFLFEPFEEEASKAIFTGNINEVEVYSQLIQPIFKSKCNSCHNAGKAKGGLILTDTISIKKGGDSGPLFIAQQMEKSLLIERINLSPELKEHMPPKGKKQLSSDEKRLVQWWISGKAEFVKTVAAYPVDEKIEAFLKEQFIRKKSGIETIEIATVPANKLTAIKREGLNIHPLGDKSSWLEARLSDRKTLSIADFKILKPVAENITVLDLGNTPMNDDWITQLASFPHLSKLFLDQTQITDQGLKKIKPLETLEYLNLYACDISDESIPHLKQFDNLKSLYLWKTKITDQGIATLRKHFPKLNIVSGKEHQSTFADAQLRSPKIVADSSIFSKELSVELKLNFPWAKIYYTLDGTLPDSTSLLYEQAFTISKSLTIKTIAIAKNWRSSEVAQASFISIKTRPKDIVLNSPPSPSYQGKGAFSLIDLDLGGANFKNGKWLGWQGENMIAILDLGKKTEVSKVFVSCLDDNNSWIFFPKSINIAASDTGANFVSLANNQFSIPSEQQIPSLKNIETSFEPTTTRYLKISVKNVAKNPKWHSAPGQASWLFIDELIVE